MGWDFAGLPPFLAGSWTRRKILKKSLQPRSGVFMSESRLCVLTRQLAFRSEMQWACIPFGSAHFASPFAKTIKMSLSFFSHSSPTSLLGLEQKLSLPLSRRWRSACGRVVSSWRRWAESTSVPWSSFCRRKSLSRHFQSNWALLIPF